MQPDDPPIVAATTRIRRDVVRYGGHPSQVGELFVSSEWAARVPVVVVLHGGFWRARYDRSLMVDLCLDLAAAGRAAWNLEYRRIGEDGGWPETFLDVAAGIDYLERLEDDYPLDVSRAVAVGHSAGGHLALWSAARARLPAGAPGAEPRVGITWAVGQAAVSDLAEAARLGLSDDAAPLLLGGAPHELPDVYALASPAARLPLGVPQLLVHGEGDDVVPAAMSAAYARRAPAEVELVVVPGTGHFEHLDPSSSAWHAVRARLPV